MADISHLSTSPKVLRVLHVAIIGGFSLLLLAVMPLWTILAFIWLAKI